jgi:hypothetical protein
MPLKPEAGRVLLRVHKTRDPIRVRIGALARPADETARLVTIEFPAAAQATQSRLQISGQG